MDKKTGYVYLADHWGTAMVGDDGVVRVRLYNGQRRRWAVFTDVKDGIKVGVTYRCENGKAVEME